MPGSAWDEHDRAMTETTNSQGLDQVWEGLRRTGIRRPRDDRWFGGVCSGTARRIGVDPVLLRVALVLLLLLGGAGVVAYAAALVLLPDEDGRIELERAAYEAPAAYETPAHEPPAYDPHVVGSEPVPVPPEGPAVVVPATMLGLGLLLVVGAVLAGLRNRP